MRSSSDFFCFRRKVGISNDHTNITSIECFTCVNFLNCFISYIRFIVLTLESIASISFSRSNINTLIRIVMPLSMPIIAVMVIFYGVGHWNSYFNALLYLKDRDKYPLSLVLREILLQGMGQEKTGAEVVDSVADLLLFETLKYAVIIVSSVPMLILYPALQRYFVKGTMVGSLKG